MPDVARTRGTVPDGGATSRAERPSTPGRGRPRGAGGPSGGWRSGASGGEGEAARFETLHDPAALDAWLAACPLAVAGAGAREADLATARRLRDAIWWLSHAAADGTAPDPAHVRTVNEVAAVPPLVPRLAAGGGHAGWAEPTAAAALSSIARDAIELLGDARQRARLRECASADCPLVFYDDSRPGRRRWCSTARCGDRARARAYRDRRRASRSER